MFVLANTGAKKVTVNSTVLGITLAGCASMRTKKVIKTEELLTKAGFQMRLADTTEKLAHLKTLPQRKIVRHQRNGIAAVLQRHEILQRVLQRFRLFGAYG